MLAARESTELHRISLPSQQQRVVHQAGARGYFPGEHTLRDFSRWSHMVLLVIGFAAAASAADAPRAADTPPHEPRARDLGVPFDGTPGPLNAITDVAGVTVGHTTLISGSGKLQVGRGPVRTGVTAVLPRGADSLSNPVFAAWFSQNGNGEMTGTTWVEESGFLEGPVMITNTHSVGVVRDAVIQWRVRACRADATGFYWSLPVVAETWDGWLERHQWISRQAAGRRARPGQRACGRRRGRGRRRRHRNDLQRLSGQGIGSSIATPRRQRRWLHRRCSRAMQLRQAG